MALQTAQGPVTWTPVAKDGAPLPAGAAAARTGSQTIAVGETYDFDVDLPPGRRRVDRSAEHRREMAGAGSGDRQVRSRLGLGRRGAGSRSPQRAARLGAGTPGCARRDRRTRGRIPATRSRHGARDQHFVHPPAACAALRRAQIEGHTRRRRHPASRSHSPVCRSERARHAQARAGAGERARAGDGARRPVEGRKESLSA